VQAPVLFAKYRDLINFVHEQAAMQSYGSVVMRSMQQDDKNIEAALFLRCKLTTGI
jgi:hypothetical protein